MARESGIVDTSCGSGQRDWILWLWTLEGADKEICRRNLEKPLIIVKGGGSPKPIKFSAGMLSLSAVAVTNRRLRLRVKHRRWARSRRFDKLPYLDKSRMRPLDRIRWMTGSVSRTSGGVVWT